MPSSLYLSSLPSLPPCNASSLTRKSYPLHRLSVKSSFDKNPTTNSNGSSNKSSSWVSPDWLISLTRSLTLGKDDSSILTVSAKLDDVSDLLGGALFLPLFKWISEYGPIYRLATGPRNFMVVSDPAIVKHVLRNYGKYTKGLLSEVSEFLFWSGFAIAKGTLWTTRHRVMVPSLHKHYLSVVVDQVFCRCAERLVEKLQSDALSGTPVNMEEKFSQLTLDVISLFVFNYNFNSLNADSPIIAVVYTAFKEAEARSTNILPYWKLNVLCKLIPRQIKAEKAVNVIKKTVEELIVK